MRGNKLNEDFKTRRVWTIRSLDIMEIRAVDTSSPSEVVCFNSSSSPQPTIR